MSASSWLEVLRKRAAAIGLYIVESEPDEEFPEIAGPWRLADDMGYDAHHPGVDLESIEIQLKQLEADEALLRMEAQGSA